MWHHSLTQWVMSKGAHNTCTYLWCLRRRGQGTLLIWTSSLGANCSDLLRRRLHAGWHQWIGCWRNENCAGTVTQLLGLPKWPLRCLFKAGSKMFYAVSPTQDNWVFQTQVHAHLPREIQWLQQLPLQPLLKSFDNSTLHLGMSGFWLVCQSSMKDSVRVCRPQNSSRYTQCIYSTAVLSFFSTILEHERLAPS